MTAAGFPHSGIAGSTLTCSSPTLIAAYRALLRLSVPRHPPCALLSLDRICLYPHPRLNGEGLIRSTEPTHLLGALELRFEQDLHDPLGFATQPTTQVFKNSCAAFFRREPSNLHALVAVVNGVGRPTFVPVSPAPLPVPSAKGSEYNRQSRSCQRVTISGA